MNCDINQTKKQLNFGVYMNNYNIIYNSPFVMVEFYKKKKHISSLPIFLTFFLYINYGRAIYILHQSYKPKTYFPQSLPKGPILLARYCTFHVKFRVLRHKARVGLGFSQWLETKCITKRCTTHAID